MKIKALVTGGSALALLSAGGGYAAWHNSEREVAKRAVLARLNDPDSAKFTHLEKCNIGGAAFVYLGQVNSRNQQGGMTGNETFVVEYIAGSPFASIAGQDPDMNGVADHYSDAYLNANFDATCGQIYIDAQKRLETARVTREHNKRKFDDLATKIEEGDQPIEEFKAEIDNEFSDLLENANREYAKVREKK